jgi:hypothetical protein
MDYGRQLGLDLLIAKIETERMHYMSSVHYQQASCILYNRVSTKSTKCEEQGIYLVTIDFPTLGDGVAIPQSPLL